jgi:protein-disulfide isomerase
MVDERLAVMQKQQSLKSLLSLKDQYQLAPAETVDNSLLYGDSNARITIKEYGDVECPYYRKMHAEVKRIVDHSEGVINWEFKHFPLAGHNPAAALEAQAIECVKEAYGISNCLASDDHKDTINNDYAEGRNSGVSATPALVIVDNKTNKEYLIKGFKTSEMLLQAIQKIVQS